MRNAVRTLVLTVAVLALWAQPARADTYTQTKYPIVLAHGRSFVPAHLTGRGVTLLNLFGIAPIGIAQIVTGRLHAATEAVPPAAPFEAVFLFFAAATAAGLFVYLWSQDRPH